MKIDFHRSGRESDYTEQSTFYVKYRNPLDDHSSHECSSSDQFEVEFLKTFYYGQHVRPLRSYCSNKSHLHSSRKCDAAVLAKASGFWT